MPVEGTITMRSREIQYGESNRSGQEGCRSLSVAESKYNQESKDSVRHERPSFQRTLAKKEEG